MCDASDAVQSAGRPENKLYRALRWALLGAASGVVAWAMYYVAKEYTSLWTGYIFWFTPGVLYGLAVGGALWRRGLSGLPRIAALAALSVCAWPIAFFLCLEVFGWPFPPAELGFLGGLVLSAVLTAGFAVLFPFARRPLLWGILLAVGACAGSVLVLGIMWSPLSFGPGAFGTIWTCWYAVYTAILSTALP